MSPKVPDAFKSVLLNLQSVPECSDSWRPRRFTLRREGHVLKARRALPAQRGGHKVRHVVERVDDDEAPKTSGAGLDLKQQGLRERACD